MIYILERYYVDKKIVPLKDAIIATAQIVGAFSNYYYFELLCPKKDVKLICKSEKLPLDSEKRKIFIQKLVKWIFENSVCYDLFTLFLDDKVIKRKPTKFIKFLGFIPVSISQDMEKRNHGLYKFDHHDDTCCWALDLNQNEFQKLKKQLIQYKLPADLFYPSDKIICKTFRSYSPKEWKEKQNPNKL